MAVVSAPHRDHPGGYLGDPEPQPTVHSGVARIFRGGRKGPTPSAVLVDQGSQPLAGGVGFRPIGELLGVGLEVEGQDSEQVVVQLARDLGDQLVDPLRQSPGYDQLDPECDLLRYLRTDRTRLRMRGSSSGDKNRCPVTPTITVPGPAMGCVDPAWV